MKPSSPKMPQAPQTPGLPGTPQTLKTPKPARAVKPPPKAVPRTTAQQGADFTAEGSPPPGHVGTDVPQDAGKPAA